MASGDTSQVGPTDRWSDLQKRLREEYGTDATRDAVSLEPSLTRQSFTAHDAVEVIFGGEQNESPNILDPLETRPVETSVPIDARLVELNLEDLIRLIDTMRRIRSDFNSVARLYLDTHLELAQFFRCDAIHRREVEAGIYEQRWHDVHRNLKRSETATQSHKEANDTLATRLETGDQSDAAIAARAAEDRDLAVKTIDNNRVWDASARVSHTRQRLNREEWRRALHQGVGEQQVIDVGVPDESALESYARAEVQFQAGRTAVARDLSYIKLAHHIAPSGPLNYKAQLNSIRALFTQYLNHACQCGIAVIEGAQKYYGIRAEAIPKTPGSILDGLAALALRLQAEIAERRRTELVSLRSYRLKVSSKPISLEIDTASPMASSVLRGISVESLGDKPIFGSMVSILPPGMQRALEFGRILPSAIEPNPSFRESIWNRSPVGTWIVSRTDSAVASPVEVLVTLWSARVS